MGVMEMKIEIEQVSERVFKAHNSSGAVQIIDGKAVDGMRPMEALLNALASCAALDLVHILHKQKQNCQSMSIEVSGIRVSDGHPSPFTEINLHFRLSGHLDAQKVNRAVQLSVEKYCSVGESLSPDIRVHYKSSILPGS